MNYINGWVKSILFCFVGISCKLSKADLYINKCNNEKLPGNCNYKYYTTNLHLINLVLPSFGVLKSVKTVFVSQVDIFA